MQTAIIVLGWVAYGVTVASFFLISFLILSDQGYSRQYNYKVKARIALSWFLSAVLAVLFGFTSLSKLHLFWLIPSVALIAWLVGSNREIRFVKGQTFTSAALLSVLLFILAWVYHLAANVYSKLGIAPFVLGALIILTAIFLIFSVLSYLDEKQGRGCILLFLAAVALLGYFGSRAAFGYRGFKTAFDESLRSLCQVSRTEGQIPSITEPAKFLILGEYTDRAHEWHSELPGKWRAKNADEVDFVICISQREVEIERCDYTPGGIITRYRIDYEIAIVNPENAQTVMKNVMAGKMPADCPSSIRSDEGGPKYGKPPIYLDFQNWLRSQAAFKLSD